MLVSIKTFQLQSDNITGETMNVINVITNNQLVQSTTDWRDMIGIHVLQESSDSEWTLL